MRITLSAIATPLRCDRNQARFVSGGATAGKAIFIAYHDANVRNVKTKRVQGDEIGSF